MNSTTLPSESPTAPGSVGMLGGGGESLGGLAVLEHPVEWMRFCEVCQSEQCFVAEFVFANGLFARCTKCGDERVAAFTRTTTEAA